MSFLVQWISKEYNDFTQETVQDEEIDSWFLMSSPWPTITIVVLYLWFVLISGPRIMENRKPFALKNVLLFYNLSLVLINAYIFIEMLGAMEKYPLKYFCTPPINRNLPVHRTLYSAMWFYYISKLMELLDTSFMALRKKRSQITILHVYHHAIMVAATWIYLKYYRVEHFFIVGLLNSGVHVPMYTYYFLAAFGPHMQKFLWWKKYLTVMQLTQFSIITVYLLAIFANNCQVNRSQSKLMFLQTLFFTGMFVNFYRKAYLDKRSQHHKMQAAYSCQPANGKLPIKDD